MQWLEFVRTHFLTLPILTKFAIVLVVIVGVPALSRRLRLPAAVGLLLAGGAIGPHGLDVIGDKRPIVDFLGEIGKLLLMFMAGLEVDLALFKAARNKVLTFGFFTTLAPLLLGTGVALLFRYPLVPAIVIGSLLASHTLLGLPTIARLGEMHLEPVTVTVGATVMPTRSRSWCSRFVSPRSGVAFPRYRSAARFSRSRCSSPSFCSASADWAPGS